MKMQIKILLLVSMFYLFIGGRNALSYYGSLEFRPINQLIRESNLIIIGTVKGYHIIQDSEIIIDTTPRKIQEYRVWKVEISEVLKGENYYPEKDVFIFQRNVFSDAEPCIDDQGKYLMFLKAPTFFTYIPDEQNKHLLHAKPAKVNKEVLNKLGLEPAFMVCYHKGAILVSDPKNLPSYKLIKHLEKVYVPYSWQSELLETQYRIYDVNDYVNAVMDFCKVMRLEKDKEAYKEGLLQLLKKGGKLYEESANAELERINTESRD